MPLALIDAAVQCAADVLARKAVEGRFPAWLLGNGRSVKVEYALLRLAWHGFTACERTEMEIAGGIHFKRQWGEEASGELRASRGRLVHSFAVDDTGLDRRAKRDHPDPVPAIDGEEIR